VLTWAIIGGKCTFLESLYAMRSAVGVLSANIELAFLLSEALHILLLW